MPQPARISISRRRCALLKSRTKTILLVEDDRLVATSQKEDLEKHGYAVILSHSGRDALTAFSAGGEIDVILMDIDLGRGIDGPETARRILTEREVPIVFLTSHDERDYVQKVREITHYGYVLKNTGSFVLLSSIEMALNLFESQAVAAGTVSRLESAIGVLRANQAELKRQDKEARSVRDELQASNEKYFDLYSLAPVGYITISEKGFILEANVRAGDLFGTGRTDIIGKRFTKFIWKEDQDIFYLFCKKLFKDKTGRVPAADMGIHQPPSCELKMQHAGGALFPAYLKATTAADEDGNRILHLIVVHLPRNRWEKRGTGIP